MAAADNFLVGFRLYLLELFFLHWSGSAFNGIPALLPGHLPFHSDSPVVIQACLI